MNLAGRSSTVRQISRTTERPLEISTLRFSREASTTGTGGGAKNLKPDLSFLGLTSEQKLPNFLT
jgi:hypothetical protein